MKKLLFILLLVFTLTLVGCNKKTVIAEVDVVVDTYEYTAETVKENAEYSVYISYATNDNWATIRIVPLTGFSFDSTTSIKCFDTHTEKYLDINAKTANISPEAIVYIYPINK